MSSQLRVTKRLTNEGWVLSGSITEGPLPRDIFVHENTGTEELGAFVSVAHAKDLSRIPVRSGAIPTERAKYVRDGSFTYLVLGEDPDSVISGLVTSVKKFSKEYYAIKEQTSVYLID